jgi:uncharacterized OB-fold protein
VRGGRPGRSLTARRPVYDGFLPEDVPDWHMPFWESLRRHEARVQRCLRCGAYRYHPKEICNRCQALDAEWAVITGRGEVYTYTVIRRVPTPAYQAHAPYVIAHVTMEEGFRMIGTLRNIEPQEVRIGMPVRISYDDVTPEWTLPAFVPAAPGDPQDSGGRR